jgi:hypothetical protein
LAQNQSPLSPPRGAAALTAQLLGPGLAPQPANVTPGVWVSSDTYLQIRTWTNQSNYKVEVDYQIEQPGIAPVVREKQLAITTTNRSQQIFLIQMGNGVLTHVTLIMNAGTPVRGMLWVEARLTDANGLKVKKLMAGYLTWNQDLAWPPLGPIDSSLTPPGNGYSNNNSPGAGADFTISVPANTRFVIRGIRATFAAAATAFTRTPRFQFDDGSNNLYDVVPGGATALTVTSGQTRTFLLQPSYPVVDTAYDNNNEVRVILPARFSQPIPTGFRVLSSTTTLQAADQWTVFTDVEEFLEPQT